MKSFAILCSGLVAAVLTFSAERADFNASQTAIEIIGNHLDLKSGGELVGRYQIDSAHPKPHFHPLNGPTGAPVTRAFPMIKNVAGETKDHPHHRAAWFCHGDVIPEGMPLKRRVRGVEGVDFWSEAPGHGKIVCTSAKNEGAAQVITQNEWRTMDGEKILDETRKISLHDLGGAKLIVFDINMHASVVPIKFGDTKEGSFAVRVAEFMSEKRKKGGVLENADGKRTGKECWGRKSAWCDYSGPVDGKTVGLAILDHPRNPYPAYWHSRDYGLMAANPFGRAKSGFPDARGNNALVKLAKGDHLKLRYALLVHPGDAKEGRVAEHYRKFAELP